MRSRRSLVSGLVLLVTLLIGATASAQPAIGVLGGLNITNIHFNVVGFGSATFNHRTSGFIGATYVMPLKVSDLSVEVDGLLQQAGTREDVEDFEIALTYIGVPVLGRYDLKLTPNRRLHIYGGISFNFKASESVRVGDDELSNLDGFEGHAMDFVFGGGVDFGPVRIDVRLAHGLSDIVRDAQAVELPVEVEVTNRGVMIAAGYTFGRR